MTDKTVTVNSHTINVSSSEKLMFPDDGLTKGDIVDYYRRMADTMLPHMSGRPVTMHRFPDGIQTHGFYHKQAPDYFPGWIERVSIEVEGEDEPQQQITCESAATLVYLANQGCVTPHVWLSRKDKLQYPDRLIFDLDPPRDDFDLVRQAARDFQAILLQLDLMSYLMTTGSRGLHVVVPLDRSADFDAVRAFARELADLLAARHPERLTTAPRKQERGERLFLDYLRNSYAQNSVAPYSLRARRGAPVATPIDWQELDEPELNSRRYTIHNIFRRLGQKADPWRDIDSRAYSLEQLSQRLSRLSSA